MYVYIHVNAYTCVYVCIYMYQNIRQHMNGVIIVIYFNIANELSV